MPQAHELLVLVVAGRLLNPTPAPHGPYIATRSLRFCARAGLNLAFSHIPYAHSEGG